MKIQTRLDNYINNTSDKTRSRRVELILEKLGEEESDLREQIKNLNKENIELQGNISTHKVTNSNLVQKIKNLLETRPNITREQYSKMLKIFHELNTRFKLGIKGIDIINPINSSSPPMTITDNDIGDIIVPDKGTFKF